MGTESRIASIRGRVRVRDRVRVRVGGGDYLLQLHTPFSLVGSAR